jgi:chemotaxis protein methyltransferase CheR
MRVEDFDMFCSILKRRSGLVLANDKSYLLESRLTPIARKHGLGSLQELADRVRKQTDEVLLSEITEAMTTNESSFFRDTRPFQMLRDHVLPNMRKNRSKNKVLRIWSAASSSGQEAYSIAMVLDEEASRFTGWRIETVGTDLSSEMIERSKAGIYTQFEVQRGLAIQMLVKYFTQRGDKWVISDKLRKNVDFKVWNLLEDLSPLGNFDIVFCRNVLIYFDQPTRSKVLDAISERMRSDGYLFLGGAETVLGPLARFKPVEGQRGLYAPLS